MAQEGKNPHAIIVLPPGAHGRIGADSLRRWFSRGRVTFAEPESEMLIRVLDLLGAPVPESGLAALRFWGQTGERSSAWMAAADPIHLETRLHSLRMRALRRDELPLPELRALFDYLQMMLGSDAELAFTLLGHYGYLRCKEPIATAPMSASVLHGLPPDEYVPSGETAPAYHQLLSELQMTLHEHEVNQRRAAAGQPEINSLWLWGGGFAPKAEARSLPFLIADDSLFRGYWNCCNGDGADWNSAIENSIENDSSVFVAVMPEYSPDDAAVALIDCLQRVKQMLKRGSIPSVTLLFRDGLSIEMDRWDMLRFWRRESPLLEKTIDHD